MKPIKIVVGAITSEAVPLVWVQIADENGNPVGVPDDATLEQRAQKRAYTELWKLAEDSFQYPGFVRFVATYETLHGIMVAAMRQPELHKVLNFGDLRGKDWHRDV